MLLQLAGKRLVAALAWVQMDPSRHKAAGAYRPPSTNAILLHPWRFQSPSDLMALMDAYDLLPVDLTEAALRRRFSWSTPGELTRFIDRRQRPPVLYVAYGDLAASSGAVFAPGCVGREALVVKGAFTGGSGDPAISKPELAEAVWEHIWQRASQPALPQEQQVSTLFFPPCGLRLEHRQVWPH